MAFDKRKFKAHMSSNGITQKKMAEHFNVNIKTINRWLSPNEKLKLERIAALCLFAGCDPKEFDPDWEGTLDTKNVARVSARISSAAKNGYWLMKEAYGVTETEILELAPTLFAIFAAAIYENNSDERAKAVEFLGKEFGLMPVDYMSVGHPDEGIVLKKNLELISEGKIFGSREFAEEYDEYFPNFGGKNPFASQLEKFSTNSKMVKFGRSQAGECPDGVGTAYDVDLTNEITKSNVELNEAIAYGNIKLFDRDLSIRPVFQPDITVFEMSFW
jgi:transcriptional regulator with XRE-family HTH domain